MVHRPFLAGLFLASLIAPAVLASSAPAPAAPLEIGVASARVWPVGAPLGFRVEISKQFSSMVPYTGALVFRINGEGIINGVYQSDSVRPDPLYGRNTPVTGGISGNNIHLQIGSGAGVLSIRGTYTEDGISGNVSGMKSGIWTIRGTRVHLQNPPQKT